MPSTKKKQEQWAALRQALRKKVLDVLGGVCCICGFSDPRALQIDHIQGLGRQDRSKFGTNTWSYYKSVILSVEANEDKYQLLCANCNWIKRAENNEIH